MLQPGRQYIVFAIALVLSLTLMGLPGPKKEQVSEYLRSALWSSGQLLFSRVISHARDTEKTRFLLTQNVKLALENMQLREADEENKRLRELLVFKQREQSWVPVPAEVIARDPDQLYDTVTIDAGMDRQLRKEMPVVTAQGLVGYLLEVAERSSVVRLITSTGSGVSAVVQSGRTQGVVFWAPGGRFLLRYVGASDPIEVGDRIVTSGMGGRYPQDITVGYVTEIREPEKDPLFKEVFLESKVGFWDLEEVFVLGSS